MSAIKVVKCPHCGHILKASKFVSSTGCPLKTCPACNGNYIDSHCYEPALKPYKPSSLIGDIGSSMFMAAIFSFAAFIIAAFATDLNYVKTIKITAIAWVALFVIFMLLIIRNRGGSEARRKAEWEESDKRLQNPQYAILLSSHGFDVPKKYLSWRGK